MSQQEQQEQQSDDAPTIEDLNERLEELELYTDALGKQISSARETIKGGEHIIYEGKPIVPRLDALETRLADIEDRLEQIEQGRADPTALEYEEMSRSQKVARLREYLIEQAQREGGVFSMEYREVVGLFDGQPPPGTAYNLMEAAGEKAGFSYETSGQSNNYVGVNLDLLNDATGDSGVEE